eukprot:17991_1
MGYKGQSLLVLAFTIVESQYTTIWNDTCASQGSWTCQADTCIFGYTATARGQCQTHPGPCFRVSNSGRMQKSTSLMFYAERPLRIKAYVDATNLDTGERCMIYIRYDDDNWVNIWYCEIGVSSRPCQQQLVTIDLPLPTGQFLLDISLQTNGGSAINHCQFDNIQLSYITATPQPSESTSNQSSKHPTIQPSVAPQPSSSVAPTTHPTDATVLSCDKTVVGTYNGQPISFIITVSFNVELIFDASASNFSHSTVEAFDTSGMLLAADSNQDGIVSFIAPSQPTGEYKFVLGGNSNVSRIYRVHITCVQNNIPTLAVTPSPTGSVISTMQNGPAKENTDVLSWIRALISGDMGYTSLIIASCVIVLLICCCIIYCACKRIKSNKRKGLAIAAERQRVHVVPINDSDSEEPHDSKITKTTCVTAGGPSKSSDLVVVWLEKYVNLSVYRDAFLDNGYDSLAIIAGISNAKEVKALGIEDRDHLKLIMTEIAKLKADTQLQRDSAMNRSENAFEGQELSDEILTSDLVIGSDMFDDDARSAMLEMNSMEYNNEMLEGSVNGDNYEMDTMQ